MWIVAKGNNEMALLNKLFSSRKDNHYQGYVTCGKFEYERWKPFNFSEEQVRILLFRECDWRGRKLLFDSKAVLEVVLEYQASSKIKLGMQQKCDKTKMDSFVEVTNGIGYQYLRPNSDVTVLGEMVFGSIAVSFQGSMSKIHSLKSPSRFVCTRVFHSPRTGGRSKGVSDCSLEDSFSNSVNSFLSQGSCYNSRQGSIGTDSLDVELRNNNYQLYSLEVDSGFCGNTSTSPQSTNSADLMCGFGISKSSPESRRSMSLYSSGSFVTSQLSNHSGGSLTSLQRRWLRNMSTSLELGSTFSLRNSINEDDVTANSNHRTKLGLAVVISVTPEEEKDMNMFLFEHMIVLDGMLERLRSAVENAYLHKEMFVHLMMEGCHSMQQWLVDIFSAPRLTYPLWLGIGLHHLNSTIAFEFLQDLCQLLAAIDTKDTNFFVSTLVTAVLTYHLGWVVTVLPDKMPPQLITQKPCTCHQLDALSRSHPYNPLWAQLGELSGAIGYPTKAARTIVKSSKKKIELLNKILISLTYFIRCSEVEKQVISDKKNCSPETVLMSSETSLSRKFLSGHDVMEVFDNRVDPGVEIGRELQSEMYCDQKTDESKLVSPPVTNVSDTKIMCQSFAKSKSECSLGKDALQTGKKKQSSNFFKKLGSSSASDQTLFDTKNQQLYPSLADLQQIENETVYESQFQPEVISQKVNRLIRVPTTAILYHLEGQDTKDEIHTWPKREQTEYQNSAPICTMNDCADSKVVLPYAAHEEDNKKTKSSDGEVIFVLGDNEQLVGLKSSGKCDNDCAHEVNNLNSKECQLPGLSEYENEYSEEKCDLPVSNVFKREFHHPADQHSIDQVLNTNIQDNSHNKQRTDHVNAMVDSHKVHVAKQFVNNNSRVVTVCPSVIELEDECEGQKTDLSDVSKPPCHVCNLSSSSVEARTDVLPLCRQKSDCGFVSHYLTDYHSSHFQFKNCDRVLKSVSGQTNVNSDASEMNAIFEVPNNLLGNKMQVNNSISSRREGANCNHTAAHELIVELPLPSCVVYSKHMCGFATSLMGCATDHYIPNMVLQGCIQMPKGWEADLKQDLAFSAHHPLLDQEISDAVCIIASVDTWEVQLMSSHTYIVDKPEVMGIRIGMSRLVANMLESLLYLWKLKTSPEYCLLHLESKLKELFLRSQALAELLLTTDFCNMELLTTSLDLDANDVPLLLAIAATHTPQVMERYGLSFSSQSSAS